MPSKIYVCFEFFLPKLVWHYSEGGEYLQTHQGEPELDGGDSSKNRFYSGIIAIREKRPQFRAGLNSKYSTDKWGFIAEEQG